MQGEVVLLYAVKEEKANQIKRLMKKQNVTVKIVSMPLYGQAVGNIALGGNLDRSPAGKNTPHNQKNTSPVFGTNVIGEMMVFSGVNSERMDVLLAELKQAGLSVSLKAVITMYNFNWTGYELYRELQKESKSF